MPPTNKTAIGYRGILQAEENSNIVSRHFACACQLICHTCLHLRKALIHFYLTCNKHPLEDLPNEGWRFLVVLGQFMQALVKTVPPQEQQDDSSLPPLDPTILYQHLKRVLTQEHYHFPSNANLACRYLWLALQQTIASLPSAGGYRSLWTNLVEQSACGWTVQATIVAQKQQAEQEIVVQRTRKEHRMLWCPLPLEKEQQQNKKASWTSIPKGLASQCQKQPHAWKESDKFDFEIEIPAGWGGAGAASSSSNNKSDWTATQALQFTKEAHLLFVSLPRGIADNDVKKTTNGTAPNVAVASSGGGGTLEGIAEDATTTTDQRLVKGPIQVPLHMSLQDLAAPALKKKVKQQENNNALEYDLIGGILFDEEDFVALIRASTESDDEGAWKLLESEEVIDMSTDDALEFLQGTGDFGDNEKDEENDEEDEDAEGICGVVCVYRSRAADTPLQQLLSDIIISHVSGQVDPHSNYEDYEEEEIVEEIIED